MGKRGPPGKSPELESAQGFPGRRRSQTKRAIEQCAEPETPAGDIQDEARDSDFVPAPPSYLTKVARRIWAEMFSNPATRLWFKTSDHRLIARYCTLAAISESDQRRPPSSTYEVEKFVRVGRGEDATVEKVVSVKRNPAYDQMLANMRELRAIEEQIAANPKARLVMERSSKPGNDDGKKHPSAPQQTAQPGAPQRPASPLGALQQARKLN